MFKIDTVHNQLWNCENLVNRNSVNFHLCSKQNELLTSTCLLTNKDVQSIRAATFTFNKMTEN